MQKPPCPPCPPPCKPCPPCDGGRIVQDKPRVQAPRPQSRIEYVPYERSVVEYQVRQRVQKIPRQRKVTQYRQQKRYDQVPVTRQVEDHYAVQVVKQYVPQYKPKVQVERVPYERVFYDVQFVPHQRTRKITRQQQPQLFRGQHDEHFVGSGRRGDWQRIDARQIRGDARVSLADGSVVDGNRFSQLIRSNPSYYQSKLIPGDSGRLSNSGTYSNYASNVYPAASHIISGGGYHNSGYEDIRPKQATRQYVSNLLRDPRDGLFQ